jgi:bacteriorhodopsin
MESNKEKPISNKLVKFTFYFTYVLLITTGTITLVEALATNDPLVRHIMNLETCISIIAGYFYSQFVNKVSTATIDYKDINETRYNDWFITTPLMILALMLALTYNTSKKSVHIGTYLSAILLNFGMLYSGYLGEVNKITKEKACLIGFAFFIGLFALIYFSLVHRCNSNINFILFTVYLVIWGAYGIVYLLDEEKKNIFYNILDVTAKCFVGLGLWTYFTKIFIL